MNSVILIGDDRLLLSSLEKISFKNCIGMNRINNSLALEFIEGRVYFDYNEDISKDYELYEIECIPINNPKFISLTYSSKSVLKKVLLQISRFDNLIIDDDMGNIVSYNEYISQI
ncbi:MAG: hypothetical protein MJA82_21785 [Clostridia bacterium]|nr:hypothetical protein [Clostridia bacterium]